jgi:hypothetical protein
MIPTGTSNPTAPAVVPMATRPATPSRTLDPEARRRLARVRRLVRAALRRGATEVAIPGVLARANPTLTALHQALSADGFTVTQVAGEDGPYAVVAW